MHVVDLAIMCVYKSAYFVSHIFTDWRLTIKFGPLQIFPLQYGWVDFHGFYSDHAAPNYKTKKQNLVTEGGN